MNGIGNGGFVHKRNHNLGLAPCIAIGDARTVIGLLHTLDIERTFGIVP